MKKSVKPKEIWVVVSDSIVFIETASNYRRQAIAKQMGTYDNCKPHNHQNLGLWDEYKDVWRCVKFAEIPPKKRKKK